MKRKRKKNWQNNRIVFKIIGLNKHQRKTKNARVANSRPQRSILTFKIIPNLSKKADKESNFRMNNFQKYSKILTMTTRGCFKANLTLTA